LVALVPHLDVRALPFAARTGGPGPDRGVRLANRPVPYGDISLTGVHGVHKYHKGVESRACYVLVTEVCAFSQSRSVTVAVFVDKHHTRAVERDDVIGGSYRSVRDNDTAWKWQGLV
jgi:hypothetical protein